MLVLWIHRRDVVSNAFSSVLTVFINELSLHDKRFLQLSNVSHADVARRKRTNTLTGCVRIDTLNEHAPRNPPHPVVAVIIRLYRFHPITHHLAARSYAKIAADALQGEQFGSALSLVKAAQRNATSLRERLSPDAWQVITEMAQRLSLDIEDDDGVVSAAELTLQELASFSGLAQENMNRAAGWRFLDMGRRAERAINATRFARQFAFDGADDDDLDILLTLADCQITYRSRYLIAPLLAPVRDLAVLDPYNPRSTAFQVAALTEHISHLPKLKEGGLIERPQRLAIAMQARLTTAEASSLDTTTLFALEQDLLTLSDSIGSHYFPHGAAATRPEKLTGLA